ncbi:hypothetical protein [Mesorhizobium sp. M0047]
MRKALAREPQKEGQKAAVHELKAKLHSFAEAGIVGTFERA